MVNYILKQLLTSVSLASTSTSAVTIIDITILIIITALIDIYNLLPAFVYFVVVLGR